MRWKPGGGAHARRRMGIFQREGHAMQRPPHFSTSQSVIRFSRPFPGPPGIQGDDGIQSRVVSFNLRQVRVKRFEGGNIPGPDGGR